MPCWVKLPIATVNGWECCSLHYNLKQLATMAKENGVTLFTLVLHTIHEMQSLDTVVYAPLKTQWPDVCYHYLQSHPGKMITK